MTIIGRNIDRLLRSTGITQKELAVRAGVTPARISLLISGATQAGRASTLRGIAKALGVTVADLWREEEVS